MISESCASEDAARLPRIPAPMWGEGFAGGIEGLAFGGCGVLLEPGIQDSFGQSTEFKAILTDTYIYIYWLR